jgi:hypothetical protein
MMDSVIDHVVQVNPIIMTHPILRDTSRTLTMVTTPTMIITTPIIIITTRHQCTISKHISINLRPSLSCITSHRWTRVRITIDECPTACPCTYNLAVCSPAILIGTACMLHPDTCHHLDSSFVICPLQFTPDQTGEFSPDAVSHNLAPLFDLFPTPISSCSVTTVNAPDNLWTSTGILISPIDIELVIPPGPVLPPMFALALIDIDMDMLE